MTNHGLVSRAWVKEGKPGNIVDMKCNYHIIIMQLSCLTILILNTITISYTIGNVKRYPNISRKQGV